MWWKELYERWIGRPPTVRRARRQRPRRHSLRLSLEQLEDRTVPSSGTSFLTPVYYPVAGPPIAVAVGDFNNDHIPDLVTANLVNSIGGAGVSVLLANGDGTFHTAINYSVGGAAQSVAVGDFNGDGNLDVVVANQGDNSGNQVNLLLGNGNGTFQPISFTLPKVTDANGKLVSQSANSVAVGDFNNDGKLDLAVGTSALYSTTTTFETICTKSGKCYKQKVTQYGYHYYINVLLGDGKGSFTAQSTTTVDTRGGPLALGDFNGDGKLDVAATTGGAGIEVLLGNGDGSLQTNYLVFDADNTVALAVGDVNHDGKFDIVTVGGSANTDCRVLLGNGNGTFQAPLIYGTASYPRSVALADFNRDGNLDIVTANYETNTVSVLLGNGNGTFQTAQNYAAGSGPSAVAVGDFKNDGFSDLAVADYATSMVAVLIDPPATTTPAAAPAAIAAMANPGVAIPGIPFGLGGTNDALLPMSGAATPQAEIHTSFISAATDAPRMDSLFAVPAGANQTCHVVPVGRGDPGVGDDLTLTELFLEQVFSGLQG